MKRRIFFTLLMGLLCIGPVTESQAQLGLLRRAAKGAAKAGKAAAKAAKAGKRLKLAPGGLKALKLGSLGTAGLVLGERTIPLAMGKLDEVAGYLTRQGDDLIMRSNLDMSTKTVGSLDDGIGTVVKRHLDEVVDISSEIGQEAIEQSMDLVIDASLADEMPWTSFADTSFGELRVALTNGSVVPVRTHLGNAYLQVDSTIAAFVPATSPELYGELKMALWYGLPALWRDIGGDSLALASFQQKGTGFWVLDRFQGLNRLSLLDENGNPKAGMEFPDNGFLFNHFTRVDATQKRANEDPPIGWMIILLGILMVLGFRGRIAMMALFGLRPIKSMLPVYPWLRLFPQLEMSKPGWWMSVPGLHFFVARTAYGRIQRLLGMKGQLWPTVGMFFPWITWFVLGRAVRKRFKNAGIGG